MLEVDKIDEELERLWEKYQEILEDPDSDWESLNEARAILYLIGQFYCEEIAVQAIERRLSLLNKKLELLEFFNLIDSNSKELETLRADLLFTQLEQFYNIIKNFKNRHLTGKFYLNEEILIERYNLANPEKELKIGYRGKIH
jgi:hypothetical protein